MIIPTRGAMISIIDGLIDTPETLSKTIELITVTVIILKMIIMTRDTDVIRDPEDTIMKMVDAMIDEMTDATMMTGATWTMTDIMMKNTTPKDDNFHPKNKNNKDGVSDKKVKSIIICVK